MSLIFEPIKLLVVNKSIPHNNKIIQSNSAQKIENENNFFKENIKLKKN
jgi:hypothetical protein